MLNYTINPSYFSPWDNVGKKKQQFPSKKLSNHLHFNFYTDYKMYDDMPEDDLQKKCNRSIKFRRKLFLYYCYLYPMFTTIKIYDELDVENILRGIISKFNFEDIKFFIEEHVCNNYRTKKFRIEYDRKRNMVKKKLKIEFGYIPSPETLNKLIEHFDLKIKPFKL